MSDWVEYILKEQKRKRKEPLEVKKMGKNYYLYYSTTVWNKEEKKRKKVSIYRGIITKDGFIERVKTKCTVRSIYEYGNARILFDIASEIMKPLKDAFPDDYGEIIARGIVRALQPTPIKLIKSRWEKLYLSREFETSLSLNNYY